MNGMTGGITWANRATHALVVSFKIAYPDNDFRPDLGFVGGIVAMRARRTVLTDSGVVKTLAMSGSSMTTTWR